MSFKMMPSLDRHIIFLLLIRIATPRLDARRACMNGRHDISFTTLSWPLVSPLHITEAFDDAVSRYASYFHAD